MWSSSSSRLYIISCAVRVCGFWCLTPSVTSWTGWYRRWLRRGPSGCSETQASAREQQQWLLQQRPGSSLASILLYSKTLFPPLSLLKKYGIQHHTVTLRAGQVLIAHGGFAHYGFSTAAGETHSFASNFMTEQWLLTGGPEFVVDFFTWVKEMQQRNVTLAQMEESGISANQMAIALNTWPAAYTCSLLSTSVRSTAAVTGGCFCRPLHTLQTSGSSCIGADGLRTALAARGASILAAALPTQRFISRLSVCCNPSSSAELFLATLTLDEEEMLPFLSMQLSRRREKIEQAPADDPFRRLYEHVSESDRHVVDELESAR
jgi:hypothetical protein